jgi:hypothetical protein
VIDRGSSATCEPLQRGLGYFIDQSHPALFFAAVQGVGDILEHSLARLDQDGRDVSPIVFESRSRTVVVNLYEPEPVTVQIVQEDGPLERVTEILGSGIGLGVLVEVRRTARILDLDLQPIPERFYKRLSLEKTTATQTFALFRGEPRQKSTRYAQVLKSMQDKYRRESTLLRDLL